MQLDNILLYYARYILLTYNFSRLKTKTWKIYVFFFPKVLDVCFMASSQVYCVIQLIRY